MENNSISAKTSEDLTKERKKCTFSTEELTQFLDGGATYTSDRRKFENQILSHKELFEGVPEEYLSHKERYEAAIRKAVKYSRLAQKYRNNHNKTEMEKYRGNFRNLTADAVFRDTNPLSLHYSMFIPTLLGQGTQEQQDYWLKRALNWEIIGTYAQTELGHGTFVRGLETTATYDPEFEQFILHSPTLTAYKWWPGSLAHTANYCVVMANLIIKGKSHGIQPFLVQIRDENTHMPLPGIKLGEIGAKLAYNNANNGFLGFDHHRIARDMMLMKNTKVLKDGTFIGSPSSKLAYGTMIFVRVLIVNSVANYLAKAATISVRYSAVRHQSQPKPNEPEPQILDYVTQQHKLFIAIASSYAFSLTANWIWDIYEKTSTEIATGNMDRLPELHALTCCLKAVGTGDACTFIERCRTSCGGHGFMQSSNLPYTYGLATAAYTYEGEFTVLMLQTARSLAKAWNAAAKDQPLSPTMSYLSDRSQSKWVNNVDGIIAGFRRVAVGKVSAVVDNIDKLVRRGISYEDAWNQSSVRSVAAAEAHCRFIILSTFHTEVQRAPLSAPLKTVLLQLVNLYANYWALEKLGDLLLFTSISESDAHELQTQYEELLEKIRPNAVGLVDAFDFRDEILHSTLGSYDGRVYERLMAEALKSPLNQEPVNQSFHKYLKPFMQGKL